MLQSRQGQTARHLQLVSNVGHPGRPIRHSERSRLARDRAPESLSPAGAAAAARDAVARGSRLGPAGGATEAVRLRLYRLFHRRGAPRHRPPAEVVEPADCGAGQRQRRRDCCRPHPVCQRRHRERTGDPADATGVCAHDARRSSRCAPDRGGRRARRARPAGVHRPRGRHPGGRLHHRRICRGVGVRGGARHLAGREPPARE